MVIIRLMLLGLITVCLADGLNYLSEDEYPDYNSNNYLDSVCSLHMEGWNLTRQTRRRRMNEGTDAGPGNFPFMGAVGWRFKDTSKYSFQCGSTLISEKFFLTAASCITSPHVTLRKYASTKPEVVALGIENIADVYTGAVGWRFKDTSKYSFQCGSTLISEKFFLTAASCITSPHVTLRKYASTKPEVVALGIENIADVYTVTEERQPKIVKIFKVTKHPEYSSPQKYNDIAIIETKGNIDYTKFIFPACVWTQEGNPEKGAVVVGWGFGNSDETGPQAEHLQYADVDFVDNYECEQLTSKWDRHLWKQGVVEGQICARGARPGVDTCEGDSGGPLVYYERTNGKFFPSVVGIMSLGQCGSPGPGVYTRVSEYAVWIQRVIFDGGLNEEFEDRASNYPSDKDTNSGGPIVFEDKGNLQRISELKCEQYITKTIFFNQDPRRIFKGKPAQQGQFPFIGALGWLVGTNPARPYQFKCGSTLISEKFVLTAGHCTKLQVMINENSTNVVIRPRVVMFGVEDLDPTKVAPDRQAKVVEILKITAHPGYYSIARYNDLAVMELAEEVVFTQYLYPACLWSRGDIDLVGKRATIVGWGKAHGDAEHIEDHLQYGEVTIMNQRSCNKTLWDLINERRWNHGMADEQMCAANLEEGTDACQGDSGGPLVYYTLPTGYSVKEFPSVVGVTSFGSGCGYATGVYARVSGYIDWIERMVWPNQTLDWRTPNEV